jgi:transposase
MDDITDVINDATKPAMRRHGEVTGVVRRRRWGTEQKGRIVAEAIAPGAVVADIARRHDLAPQQLWNWIRGAKDRHFALPAAEAAFVPVVREKLPASKGVAADRCAAIEIAIGAIRVRVRNGADADTLEVVLRALGHVGR